MRATNNNNEGIVSWGTSTSGRRWTYRINSGGQVRAEVEGGSIVHNRNILDGDWHHTAVSWAADGSPDIIDAKLYADGATGSSSASPESMNTAVGIDVKIGNNHVNRFLTGELDEVRISSVARSADWIWAVWMNSGSNASFNCHGMASNTRWTVTNQPASHFAPDSARLNVEVSGEVGGATVVAYWGAADGGTDPDAWANTNSSFSPPLDGRWNYGVSATGLTVGTTYYFTFKLTDGQQAIWARSSESFVLQPPVVDHVPEAAVTSRTAILYAELSAGDPADLVLFWGERDGGTNMAAWDRLVDLGHVSSGTYSVVVSNLIACVPYVYRVYASNSVDAAWAPHSTEFRSPATGLAIHSETFGNPGDEFITLNGGVTATGAVADVRLYYGVADGGTSPAAWDHAVSLGSFTDTVEQLSHTLFGLAPDQIYFYRFHASNCTEDVWSSAG
ncbi:MAG: LamG-like jellyroll fold domain-containing protein, partial [Verrucomicrobiota bacterium]